MRILLTLLSISVALQAQNLEFSVGRSQTTYERTGSVNVNSAFYTLSMSYEKAWNSSSLNGHFRTENGLSRDDGDIGGGLSFYTATGFDVDSKSNNLSAYYLLNKYPSYDNVLDNQSIQINFAREIELSSHSFLNIKADGSWHDFLTLTELTGYEVEPAAVLSLSSDRGFSFRSSFGLGIRTYGENAKLSSRITVQLQGGMRLSENSGLSLITDGALDITGSKTAPSFSIYADRVHDSYRYSRAGSALQFRYRGGDSNFYLKLATEWRDYSSMERSDWIVKSEAEYVYRKMVLSAVVSNSNSSINEYSNTGLDLTVGFRF
ncbi:MAG: hypothetical protein JNL74_04850 [Fibrobacteres bacterium]|nr:hypothetical protein [Fibrobacterota bacterium]